MDVLHQIQAVLEIIRVPISHMREHREQSFELKSGLRSVKQELEVIKAGMGNYDEVQVLELAYDIEDFVQGTLIPWASSLRSIMGGGHSICEHLEVIRSFKGRIEKLPQKRRRKRVQSGGTDDDYCTQEVDRDLVGIDKPKMELLELLSLPPTDGPHAGVCQLRVISIVGAPGIGKTTLARAVYEDPCSSNTFDCLAWIVASGCNDARKLLMKVLKKVQQVEAGGTTSADLHSILAEKRYLIVIDDVQGAELWKDTVDSFPKSNKGSRIIVTTRIRSVATVCSHGSYVHTMQCLDEADSRDLLWKKVFGEEKKPVASLVHGSINIFKKCDGLPLALTSVAKYLSIKGNNLKRSDCEELGETLGTSYLVRNKAVISFGEMSRRLVQCYDSLPDYAHKACMLSLSMFPFGHHINCKSFIRRLVAEGVGAGVSRKCFHELIGRSIIEPILVYNNSKFVLRFKVHGIILEFTIQESVSRNFVTLIHEHDPLRMVDNSCARVRRLAFQSSPKERFDEVEDKSALRSLSMFNSELVDFKNFKMLRVLDLESCKGMDDRLLEGICELLLLKYLSIRKTNVNSVPKKIAKLQCLETLDTRETAVAKLSKEVIMLPKLAYLFGKFELPDMLSFRETSVLHEFMTTKSELHTLVGIVVAQDSEAEPIILKARKLKKVKVWREDSCSSAPGSTPYSHIPLQDNAIGLVSFLEKRFTDLDSVSIDSSGVCKAFMASLKAPCTIRSIKLRGELDTLPNSATLNGLCNLTKLHLFSSGLHCQQLSTLQSLPCLENLKLVEDREGFWEDSFVVENEGFESLHELCFEAQKLPKLQFKHGALLSLTSLQLLCSELCQMQVNSSIDGDVRMEGISYLTNLSEVILHPAATEAQMQAWKSTVYLHPNRPSVKRQSRIINNIE